MELQGYDGMPKETFQQLTRGKKRTVADDAGILTGILYVSTPWVP